MTDKDVIQKIANALEDAFIRQPIDAIGSRRTQIAFSKEEALFLARTALLAARDAGFDFYQVAGLEKVSRMPASIKGGSSLRRFYTGPSGDTWDFGREIDTGRVFVKHVGNEASGGHSTDYDVDAFLSRDRGHPQVIALQDMLGTLAGEATDAPRT